jgi:hypothetical protein
LRIHFAESTHTSHGGLALLKSHKTAIHATHAAVLRTPGIILSFGARLDPDHAHANYQQEPQEPHGRLLLQDGPQPRMPIPSFYSIFDKEARRIAGPFGWLKI